jgi:hypothetical protein
VAALGTVVHRGELAAPNAHAFGQAGQLECHFARYFVWEIAMEGDANDDERWKGALVGRELQPPEGQAIAKPNLGGQNRGKAGILLSCALGGLSLPSPFLFRM